MLRKEAILKKQLTMGHIWSTPLAVLLNPWLPRCHAPVITLPNVETLVHIQWRQSKLQEQLKHA